MKLAHIAVFMETHKIFKMLSASEGMTMQNYMAQLAKRLEKEIK